MVPRISDLPEIEAFLQDQVPEVTYVVAHGQMAAGELDDRMNAFYDGKYDVLLATTIVESGLDIPTANTMIMHRADMFGLAQLYQIRGRVGRSKTRAYAYLTTKPRAQADANGRKAAAGAGVSSTRWGRALRWPVRIWIFAGPATCWAKNSPARCAMWAMSCINRCWKRRLPRSRRARWKG